MLSRHKKTINLISFFLMFSFLAVFFIPRAANASFAGVAVSVPSYITGSEPEEIRNGESGVGFGLNTAAVAAAKLIINKLTDSVIKWVDTGFKGSPSFVTNPGAYFKDLADQVSGVFISQLGAADLLCPRFKPQILLSLTYERPDIKTYECTFGKTAEEWNGFVDDFNKGGWGAFIKVSTGPQNSPYGTYLKASDELAQKKAEAAGRGKAELNWGSGFVSLKQCVEVDEDNYNLCVDGNFLSPADCKEAACTRYENTTPGKIISGQVMEALGSDINQMNSADTIDKTINAALGSILDATFGQVMKSGLASLSSQKKPKPKPMELRPLKSSVKNSFATSIDQEKRYKGYKEKTYDLYLNAMMKVSLLIGCKKDNNDTQDLNTLKYTYKNREFTLPELLEEFKNRVNQLDKDKKDSDKIIKQATDINDKVDKATSATELQKLMTDFAIEVRPYIHSSEGARKELESETDELAIPLYGEEAAKAFKDGKGVRTDELKGVAGALNDCTGS